MGARRFGPDIGQFLQEDVYEDALGDLALSVDPLTQNRYALAGRNPITFVESDGHEPASSFTDCFRGSIYCDRSSTRRQRARGRRIARVDRQVQESVADTRACPVCDDPMASGRAEPVDDLEWLGGVGTVVRKAGGKGIKEGVDWVKKQVSKDNPASPPKPTRPSPGPARPTPSRGHTSKTAPEADEAFHYTKGRFIESIEKEGLRPDTYVTSRGDLSPLQAQIDLALPPNRGLPDAVLRVDLAGLRKAGYDIGLFTQVGRKFNMPGGGTELRIEQAIPPRFLEVIRR
jgi:hypothetical protein